jgi:aspartate carbamoyltransferase regulatory subunit
MTQLEDNVLTQENEKILPVAAIENGTVIDHITAGKAILLLRLLKLEMPRYQITLGLNLPSSRFRIKDLIKVSAWELTPKETSQIAIFSPSATINIIQNYRVVNKFAVTIPTTVSHIIICPNQNCITNHEKAERLFFVSSVRKEVQLKCKYCEKSFFLDDITQYDM